MRLAADFLSFEPPRLLEGAGSIKRLASFIKAKGCSGVFVVTDKGVVADHLLDGLFAGLDEQAVSYMLFDGTQANPTIQDIEDALKLYQDSRCEAVIAFGGDSPMDCAKGCVARHPVRRADDGRHGIGDYRCGGGLHRPQQYEEHCREGRTGRCSDSCRHRDGMARMHRSMPESPLPGPISAMFTPWPTRLSCRTFLISVANRCANLWLDSPTAST